MCNLRMFVRDDISCPNMAILNIGLYLVNRCPQSKNKLNFDPLVQKEVICATSGTLATCQVSCPNMAILKNGLYLGNHYPQSKISSILTPWGRKSVQMCNFWNFGQWPSWLSSRASRPMGLLFFSSHDTFIQCNPELETIRDIQLADTQSVSLISLDGLNSEIKHNSSLFFARSISGLPSGLAVLLIFCEGGGWWFQSIVQSQVVYMHSAPHLRITIVFVLYYYILNSIKPQT